MPHRYGRATRTFVGLRRWYWRGLCVLTRRVGCTSGRPSPQRDGMAGTERPPHALAGWPGPWRVVAVLTGALPVRGALRDRPPYQYRVCSAPAAVGITTAVLLTLNSATYLTPNVLRSYGVSVHLAILFELMTFTTTAAALWLTVARGRRAARLLGSVGDLLSARRLRGFPVTASSRGRYLLVAAMAAVDVFGGAWNLSQSVDVLAPGITSMPPVFSNLMSVLGKLWGLSLLTLSIHLMRVLADEFDAISADLQLILHPTPVQRVHHSARTGSAHFWAKAHRADVDPATLLSKDVSVSVLDSSIGAAAAPSPRCSTAGILLILLFAALISS